VRTVDHNSASADFPTGKSRTPNFRWRPESGLWFWRLVIKKEAWGRGVYVCHLATRAPKRRTKSQREDTVMYQMPIRRGLNLSTCWRLMKKREGGSNLTSLIYCRVWRSQPKVCPGGSPVPFLLREAMPSLQAARGTCTRQFNIQRAQLPPWREPCRIKEAYYRGTKDRFD
jgi:hypothetical protein